jgi:WD40 repeat protein
MLNPKTKDRFYGVVAGSAGVALTAAAVFVLVAAAADWKSSRPQSSSIRWTDETPSWSPDGRTIVFASNRARPCRATEQLFLIRADGSRLRRLTFAAGEDAREPSFSPNGAWILYDQNVLQPDNDFTEHSQIAAIRVNGGRFRLLSGGLDGDLEQPAWSPDGRKVAFFDTVWDGDSGEYISSLYVVDADGGGLRKLAANVDGWSYSWSPDSKRIAVAGVDDQLYLLRVDRPRPLAVHGFADSVTTDIAWSPDRNMIAYVDGKRTWDGSGDLDPRYLWTENLTTGRRRRLREATDSATVGSFEQTIAWLPGRTPLLAVYDGTETDLLRPEGQLVRTLPGGDNLAAGSASPSGRRLVQVESSGGYRSALVVASTTGGSRRRITQTGT